MICVSRSDFIISGWVGRVGSPSYEWGVAGAIGTPVSLEPRPRVSGTKPLRGSRKGAGREVSHGRSAGSRDSGLKGARWRRTVAPDRHPHPPEDPDGDPARADGGRPQDRRLQPQHTTIGPERSSRYTIAPKIQERLLTGQLAAPAPRLRGLSRGDCVSDAGRMASAASTKDRSTRCPRPSPAREAPLRDCRSGYRPRRPVLSAWALRWSRFPSTW